MPLDFNNQLAKIASTADCIVVPGGFCDETGQPTGDALLRCKAERWLKNELEHYKHTVVSGGGGRGVKAYITRQRQQNPAFFTTEAEQMISWAISQGEYPSTYFVEPFALDTLGNLVFSTKLLLLHDLRRPVFLSQAHHLYQLQIAAEHWFANCGIEPHFFEVEDTNEEGNKRRAFAEMQRSLRDSREGYGFPRAFARETLSLPSVDWKLAETKWAFEMAIRWLFRHSRDKENGKLRYRQHHNEAELLHEVSVGPGAVSLEV